MQFLNLLRSALIGGMVSQNPTNLNTFEHKGPILTMYWKEQEKSFKMISLKLYYLNNRSSSIIFYDHDFSIFGKLENILQSVHNTHNT